MLSSDENFDGGTTAIFEEWENKTYQFIYEFYVLSVLQEN